MYQVINGKGDVLPYGPFETEERANEWNYTFHGRHAHDFKVVKVEATQQATGKPATITAAELVGNLAHWAMLKDARKLNLIWKGDHIDGIGQIAPNGYAIQYGGIINDHDIVSGDTLIAIEWLTTPQPATAQSANETAEGSGAAWDIDKAYEDIVYKERDLHLALCSALHIEFDGYPSPDVYVDAIVALREQVAGLRAFVEKLASFKVPSTVFDEWERGSADARADIMSEANEVLADLREAAKKGRDCDII